MTPSDDLSPPRRPIFFPVVIATVFLTIIGMTGGFVLGERHRRVAAANTSGQPSTTPPTEVSPVTSGGPLCPEATRQTAVRLNFPSELRQVMKIETVNGTTVWICQDDAGAYYYQGKTGGLEAPLVEGKNGLFLSGVRHSEDSEQYVAVADNGNRFTVNRKQLQVYKPKTDSTETYQVVNSE